MPVREGRSPSRPRGDAAEPPVLLRHRLEYLAARVFGAACRSVPLAAAYWLCRRAGWLLHRIDGAHRRVARANLERHLPDDDGNPSRQRVRRIAREVFDHLVMNGMELVRMRSEIARTGFDRCIEVRGVEHIRAALERGRGVIFVSAHLGNWEVFGAAARHLGLSPASVYRPLDNPLLDRWIQGLRGIEGQDVIPKHGAVRGMLSQVRRGGLVAVLVDQDARGHGVFVPFLGEPASTIPTPAELALRTGCAIVPGFSIRVGPGFRFLNWFEPEVEVTSTGDRAADVLRVTADINRRVEAAVLQAPSQWLWLHRRWKTRPPAAGGGSDDSPRAEGP